MVSNKTKIEVELREFLQTEVSNMLDKKLRLLNLDSKIWLSELNPQNDTDVIASFKDKWKQAQENIENNKTHLKILLKEHSLANYIKEIDQLLKKIYGEEYYSLSMSRFYNPFTFELKEPTT